MSGKRARSLIVLVILIACLAASIVGAVSIGSFRLPLSNVYGILSDQLLHRGEHLAAGAWSVSEYQIVWNVRMPRVLFGALCGMGLSVCGAVMQCLVLNPIADPYVLGISSGASAGAAWAMLMPLPYFVGQYQITFTAMLGAMLSSFAVYSLARMGSGGRLQPVTLLLSGTAVNAVMSAVTSLLVFLAKSQESITAVYNWQMGSIAAAQWTTLRLPLVGVLAATLFFTSQGKKFNLLMMGDDDATAMGLHVTWFRTGMFAVCSITIATLVSVTGIIGFVGLMVPHLVRLMTGSSNNSVVIPYSGLLGAVYLIWADAAARGLFGPAELPLGIITAFVGAPFFLFLMLKKRYGGGRF
nr:iron ABC transporter permease [uncultured Oscillibacter sp.]